MSPVTSQRHLSLLTRFPWQKLTKENLTTGEFVTWETGNKAQSVEAGFLGPPREVSETLDKVKILDNNWKNVRQTKHN